MRLCAHPAVTRSVPSKLPHLLPHSCICLKSMFSRYAYSAAEQGEPDIPEVGRIYPAADAFASLFGEFSLLEPYGRAVATVKVPPHAYCDAFVLASDDFQRIATAYPSFRHRIARVKRARESENREAGRGRRPNAHHALSGQPATNAIGNGNGHALHA